MEGIVAYKGFVALPQVLIFAKIFGGVGFCKQGGLFVVGGVRLSKVFCLCEIRPTSSAGAMPG
jgi:hypothetical protein